MGRLPGPGPAREGLSPAGLARRRARPAGAPGAPPAARNAPGPRARSILTRQPLFLSLPATRTGRWAPPLRSRAPGRDSPQGLRPRPAAHARPPPPAPRPPPHFHPPRRDSCRPLAFPAETTTHPAATDATAATARVPHHAVVKGPRPPTPPRRTACVAPPLPPSQPASPRPSVPPTNARPRPGAGVAPPAPRGETPH